MQGAAHVVGIDLPQTIDRHRGNLATERFEVLAGIHHRVMFDVGRDDVIARPADPENGQIVGLGPATGKHHLRGAAAEQMSHRLTSLLDRRPAPLTVVVDRGGVPEVLAEIGLDGGEHFGKHRGGGVVVEVDAAHKHPWP